MPISRGRKNKRRSGQGGSGASGRSGGGGLRGREALNDPGLQAVTENVDDEVRVCFMSDPEMGGQVQVTGIDPETGRPTHEGAELEESIPVAKFEPAKALVVQDRQGKRIEVQSNSAISLGLQRWLGSGSLRTAKDWQVVRTAAGLELRDPSGYVFSRGGLELPPVWVSAAVSRGFVAVVYGCKVGVRTPPGSASYSPQDRWAELQGAQKQGIVAAGLVTYVNHGTPGPNPPAFMP